MEHLSLPRTYGRKLPEITPYRLAWFIVTAIGMVGCAGLVMLGK